MALREAGQEVVLLHMRSHGKVKGGYSMNEKKKKQPRRLLHFHWQGLPEKKRYLLPLLRFLVIAFVGNTATLAGQWLSYKTYPVFLLLLASFGCLLGFAIEKCVAKNKKILIVLVFLALVLSTLIVFIILQKTISSTSSVPALFSSR